MKINHCLLIGATVILTASSCVSSKQYKTLQADYSTFQGKTNALAKANDDCQSTLALPM